MEPSVFLRFLGAFGSVISFGVLPELPQKHLLHTGIVGGLGWLVHYLVNLYGKFMPLAVFISSLVIAGMSHVFARKRKAPVTIFLVTGIFPLVPGASIYKSVYYMIQDMHTLSNQYLVETLQVAGAIAMAVFFVDPLFRLGQDHRKTL